MTADTTFKEFVEGRNLNFSQLEFGSPEYQSLVEVFNKAKLELEAEEEARESERLRAVLMLNDRPVRNDGASTASR